jgi:hypothetical protein
MFGNMNNIPFFFQTLCAKKQICNATAQELNTYFPLQSDGNPYVELEGFDCLCVGYKNGQKHVARFSFEGCESVPLLGAHRIKMDGKVMCVDSLTYFKKEVLKFEDHVSFDRCTFILLDSRKKVVRLNLVRERLRLPVFSGGRSLPLQTPPICTEMGERKNHFKMCVESKTHCISFLTDQFADLISKIKQSPEFEDPQAGRVFFNSIVSEVFTTAMEMSYEEGFDVVEAVLTAAQEEEGVEKLLELAEYTNFFNKFNL